MTGFRTRRVRTAKLCLRGVELRKLNINFLSAELAENSRNSTLSVFRITLQALSYFQLCFILLAFMAHQQSP
ncbi:hypothetical protein CROQUDRAFT_95416 [Cronartium quercuum f. sp. fusiforme G11]|uniref:Uncharacterized protein n=1 Tax=Cronartium quercuum f. sp. fusiforme G11 TaxID=708437 RepID=A0A9P6NDT1_9BASI|nr:hypothetical protein CROQUDRAFT_95416 [Cronartium quercuum f. sp. fusiforme G11]